MTRPGSTPPRSRIARHALGALAAALACGCSTPAPSDARGPFTLGLEAASTGDTMGAIVQFTLAIENARGTEALEGFLERGTAYVRLAQMSRSAIDAREMREKALEDFQAVLASPSATERQRARGLEEEGRVLIELERLEEAERSLRAALDSPRTEGQTRKHIVAAAGVLGWLILGDEHAIWSTNALSADDGDARARVARALGVFSRGLELEADDVQCNLGKGLCLLLRHQSGDAEIYLERCTARSRAGRESNPRGHYCLARAIEAHRGYQERALAELRLAVEQDSERTFTPLYEHLLDVILVYSGPDEALFDLFLDSVLTHASADPSYWEKVERFSTRLLTQDDPRHQELGLFVRGLARARLGAIQPAVADALSLAGRTDFLALLARIFPVRPPTAASLYGRALTLRGARRTGELSAFFEDAAFRDPPPDVSDDELYKRALVLEAQNTVTAWLEGAGRAGRGSSPEATLERDRILGKARAAFETYLRENPGNLETRMALGQIQELMESFSAALGTYEPIVRESPDATEAFRAIVRLHKDRLLPEKDRIAAWELLQTYTGAAPDVLDHIRKSEAALRDEIRLFCTACGRKGAPGDAMCQECGRRLAAGAPLEAPANP